MDEVVFFNHFHNGDLHVSRGIVQRIIQRVKQEHPLTKFKYSHSNDAHLLCDIPELAYDPLSINWLDRHQSTGRQNTDNGSIVYLNTWFDQQHQKYARYYGILTLDALYAALNDSCWQHWGFRLDSISTDPRDFYPTIQYSRYSIGQARNWLEQHPEPKILIENGLAMSNQAYNFDMTGTIQRLAPQFPDKTFILSKKDSRAFSPNVHFTDDIIQKPCTDLNEISYLSTECNVLIGRASGVFTFWITRDNLFQRSVKMLCFSHLMAHQRPFWTGKLFADRVQHSADVSVYPTSQAEEAEQIIRSAL